MTRPNRMPEGAAVFYFEGRVHRLQALQRDVDTRLTEAESFVEEIKTNHMLVSSMLLLSKNLDWSKWDDTCPDMLLSCSERNLGSKTEASSTSNTSVSVADGEQRPGKGHGCAGQARCSASRQSSSSCTGDCSACLPNDGIKPSNNQCDAQGGGGGEGEGRLSPATEEEDGLGEEQVVKPEKSEKSDSQNGQHATCHGRLSDGDSGIDAITLNEKQTEESKPSPTTAHRVRSTVVASRSTARSFVDNSPRNRPRSWGAYIDAPIDSSVSLTKIIHDLRRMSSEDPGDAYWAVGDSQTPCRGGSQKRSKLRSVNSLQFFKPPSSDDTVDGGSEVPQRDSATGLSSVIGKLSMMFTKKW